MQFCSRRCREAANATYHKYECLFTDSLYQVLGPGWTCVIVIFFTTLTLRLKWEPGTWL